MDHDIPDASVYRYYDEFDALLYVGITRQGPGRNRQHNRGAAWWPYVARQEVEHVPTRELALDRERELIGIYSPPFNVQHNGAHEAALAAYLAFRATHAEGSSMTGGAIWSMLKQRLPLIALGSGLTGGVLRLRTLPEHAPLAGLLRLADLDGPVPAFHRKRVGHLCEISHHGPFAVLHISGKRLPAATWGVALIKQRTRASQAFFPKQIFLDRGPDTPRDQVCPGPTFIP